MSYATQPLSKEEEADLIQRITAATPAKKSAAEFDFKRVVRQDPRDPRTNPDQWPCYNQHVDGNKGANAHGCWIHCATCDMRMTYVPRKGSPANQTSVCNPAMVLRMLNSLQPLMQNRFPNAKICHAMMQKINANEVLETAHRGAAPQGCQVAKECQEGLHGEGLSGSSRVKSNDLFGQLASGDTTGLHGRSGSPRHLSKDEMDKLKQVVAERQAAQAESMEENTMA